MDRSPQIVEIVGPPGVGKTTFTENLYKRSKNIQIGVTPYFRRIRYIPFFAWHTIRLLPTLLHIRAGRDGRWLTRREIALMIILTGWQQELERKVFDERRFVVLDEGPICYLTRLLAFGSESIKGQSAQSWWNKMFHLWAETLDIVIQFDLPDAMLVERIRAREMWQEVKALSDQEAINYLGCFRAAQEHVLAALGANERRPVVFNFDMAQKSPDGICDEVMSRLGFAPGGD